MAGDKQTAKEKFGYVTLTSFKAEGTNRIYYRVRWRDPATQKDIQKRLVGIANKDAARAEARRINNEVTDERARLRNTPTSVIRHMANAPGLREAIDEAIAARNRRKQMTPEHLYNLKRYQEKFLAFMDERFPGVKQWREVRRTPHVSQYVELLQDNNMKAVSIRHCLEIISLTANYFADEHEEFGYRPLRVLKIAPELDAPAKNYMTVEQLEEAIQISREMESAAAELGFLLGGWCGLNLREIARLTFADFDFQNGLLTIRKSKNKYRKRIIPLPSFVLDAVREHLNSQVVKDVAGSLFVRDNGQPADNRYLARPMDVVLHRMGIRYATPEAARAAKAVKMPEDAKSPDCLIVPKDVRKTFINIARKAGSERETLRRYVGHVPSDVMSAHYEDFTIEGFRTEVVARIEKVREQARSKVGKKLVTRRASGAAAAR